MLYSIWLQPSAELETILRQMIENHAQSLSTPVFVPHVTLVGGLHFDSDDAAIEAVNTLTKALALLPPAQCRFGEVAKGSSFYQCVFVKQLLAPALQLWFDTAVSILQLPANSFMPHLSIVYGDISETDKDNCVSLVRQELLELSSKQLSFTPSSLHIWRTEVGRTEDWSLLLELPIYVSAR